MLTARTLALFLSLGLVATPIAHAEDVLVLYVQSDVPIDGEALRAGIARDLGRDVALGEAGSELLSIAMRDGEAEVRYATPETARSRRVALPDDRDETTAALVLIAANLVRDPTDQLVEPAHAVEVVPAAPAPVAPAVPPEEPEPNFAVSHPFSLGLDILGGAASTPDGVHGYWYLGADLMGTVHPAIRIGVTRLSLGLGFSSVESFIFSLQGTPTFELFGFVDRHVQVYGQIGVALQGRAQTAFREGLFQVAPYLGGGVRFWITDWFTIGVDIGLNLVATDSFLMGDVALPQGSIAGSAGLSVGFHLMP